MLESPSLQLCNAAVIGNLGLYEMAFAVLEKLKKKYEKCSSIQFALNISTIIGFINLRMSLKISRGSCSVIYNNGLMTAISIALMRFTCKDRKIGKEIKSHLIVCSKHWNHALKRVSKWKKRHTERRSTLQLAIVKYQYKVFRLNCCFNVEGMETSGCRLSEKIN